MQDVIFVPLFILLLGAPGIIWLFMRPHDFTGRSWLAPIAASILTVLFGGAMLNQLAGWSEVWGFLIVWVVASTVAWWVPTYTRNRRGRLAAEARGAAEDSAAAAKKVRRKARKNGSSATPV